MTSTSKRYCSVPQCKNYKSQTVSIHIFPKNPVLKQKWARALRIGKPVTKGMSVCSEHFVITDFYPVRPDFVRRHLKIGAIPSQKIPVRVSDQSKSSTSKARISRAQKRGEKRNCEIMEIDEHTFDSEETSQLIVPNISESFAQCDCKPVVFFDKCVQVNELKRDKNILFHEYLMNSSIKLSVYTGINIQLFNSVTKVAINTLKLFPTLNATNIEKKLCIILTKLKLDLSFRELAIMYEISTTTAQHYFHQYIQVLYYGLKPAIYFPSKEENIHNIPNCFKNYKNVRIVIDSTEVPIQKSKCLDCRIRTYSHYKKTHTSKFLISVAPAGLIAHVSSAYGGHVSDKAIFNAENIINKLTPNEDAVMVNKGILIEKECAENGIQLIKPQFLRQNGQFSKEDTLKTAAIARARVQIERSLQRIQNFKIFSNKLEWPLVPYLTAIMTVICALVNLSKPILQDDKFNK